MADKPKRRPRVEPHEVAPVPLTVACARCGREFAPDEPADIRCPECATIEPLGFP